MTNNLLATEYLLWTLDGVSVDPFAWHIIRKKLEKKGDISS